MRVLSTTAAAAPTPAPKLKKFAIYRWVTKKNTENTVRASFSIGG